VQISLVLTDGVFCFVHIDKSILILLCQSYNLELITNNALYLHHISVISAADSGRAMQEQMATGGGMMGPQVDPAKAFEVSFSTLLIIVFDNFVWKRILHYLQ